MNMLQTTAITFLDRQFIRPEVDVYPHRGIAYVDLGQLRITVTSIEQAVAIRDAFDRVIVELGAPADLTSEGARFFDDLLPEDGGRVAEGRT